MTVCQVESQIGQIGGQIGVRLSLLWLLGIFRH